MNENEVRDIYSNRRNDYLKPLESTLKNHLKSLIEGVPRIDRISVRSKSVDRFIAKALKVDEQGKRKYSDPINQIQDQIGARIVTFYSSDVIVVADTIKSYLNFVEEKKFIPDTTNVFGYEGRHLMLFMPDDIITEEIKNQIPPFFELQIKTLFQHAWGEAEHDLGYKPNIPLTFEQKRKLSFTAAQAWGADMVFLELFEQQQNLVVENSQKGILC